MLIAPINAPSLNIGTTTIVRAPPSLAIGSSGYSVEDIDKVDDVFDLRQATESGRRRERKNRVLR